MLWWNLQSQKGWSRILTTRRKDKILECLHAFLWVQVKKIFLILRFIHNFENFHVNYRVEKKPLRTTRRSFSHAQQFLRGGSSAQRKISMPAGPTWWDIFQFKLIQKLIPAATNGNCQIVININEYILVWPNQLLRKKAYLSCQIFWKKAKKRVCSQAGCLRPLKEEFKYVINSANVNYWK